MLRSIIMLLLIIGLPGTGKTTLARAYAIRYGLLHLNSDALRHALGLMGHYGPEDKQKVYDVLLERARIALLAGHDVVVDGTFYKEALRQPFRRLADECTVPLFWTEVRAQDNTIRERLLTPRPDSEADVAVYEKIRAAAEPLLDDHLALWSDQLTLEEMAATLRTYTHPDPLI